MEAPFAAFDISDGVTKEICDAGDGNDVNSRQGMCQRMERDVDRVYGTARAPPG
jgi:hypothetical protein